MITVGVVKRSLKRDVQRENEKKASNEQFKPGSPTIHRGQSTRYFHKYTPPRPLPKIEANLKRIEKEIAEMVDEVTT